MEYCGGFKKKAKYACNPHRQIIPISIVTNFSKIQNSCDCLGFELKFPTRAVYPTDFLKVDRLLASEPRAPEF